MVNLKLSENTENLGLGATGMPDGREIEPNKEELSSLERYARAFHHDLLRHAEVIELSRRSKGGDEQARERLIVHNLRLVVFIARQYARRDNLLDLIQEGNIGLMKAVERFDPEKDCFFSTYAIWWIRQRILLSLSQQERTIRLPAHIAEHLAKVQKTQLRLLVRFEREPTMKEIAQEAGLSVKKARSLLEAGRNVESLQKPVRSHSARAGDSDATVSDLIGDNRALSPDSQAVAKEELAELARKVRDGLACLLTTRVPRRAIAMFLARWNITDGAEKTMLEKVGQRFGVTRERARQAQSECLRKLKARGYDFAGVGGWERTLERIHELEDIVGTQAVLCPDMIPTA